MEFKPVLLSLKKEDIRTHHTWGPGDIVCKGNEGAEARTSGFGVGSRSAPTPWSGRRRRSGASRPARPTEPETQRLGARPGVVQRTAGGAHPRPDALGAVRVQQRAPRLLEGRAGGADVGDHHGPAVPSQRVLLGGAQAGVTGTAPAQGLSVPRPARPGGALPRGSCSKPRGGHWCGVRARLGGTLRVRGPVPSPPVRLPLDRRRVCRDWLAPPAVLRAPPRAGAGVGSVGLFSADRQGAPAPRGTRAWAAPSREGRALRS